MKFIPKLGKTEKELKTLEKEIDILRTLAHENIVQLLDSLETDNEMVVVMEYALVSVVFLLFLLILTYTPLCAALFPFA
jgi:serine/threonine protein kinase